MFELEIQRCTRRCAKTGEELKPGEEFYSVLLEKGDDIVRLDYSKAGWEGSPEEAMGWWKSQMPSPHARKVNWAPNDVMMHYFEQLDGQQEKADVRYVLTLLMIRRRVLRLEETEIDDQGRETLAVYCSRNESEYKVPVVDPDDQRIVDVQNELAQLLFADAT